MSGKGGDSPQSVRKGRAQKPEAQSASSAWEDIPELEVTVVARRKGNQIIATERFVVPLLITPGNAKDFAMALGRHYTKAVSRVLDVVKNG